MPEPREIVIGAYQYLETVGESPSVNKALAIARSIGYHLHKKTASEYLRPFIDARQAVLGTAREPGSEPGGNHPASGSGSGSEPGSSSSICTVPEVVPKVVPGYGFGTSSEPAAEPVGVRSALVLPHTPSPATVPLVSNLQQQPRAHESGQGNAASAFGKWFLQRGLELGVIPEHHGSDPQAWAERQLEQSELLLASYAKAEIRARAERLFGAHKAGKIRGSVTIASLAQKWDWEEIRAPRAGKPLPAMVQREIDELRAAEERDAELVRARYAS